MAKCGQQLLRVFEYFITSGKEDVQNGLGYAYGTRRDECAPHPRT